MTGATIHERTWLASLAKVRIIVVTFLLGVQLAVSSLSPSSVDKKLFVSVILLWYTVGVFYIALLRLWQDYVIQARLQVLTDLCFAAAVVYATGGIDSSFQFLYPLLIITAAILLPRYWAYLTAALAFILSGALLELTYFDLVRSYSTVRPGLRILQAAIVIDLFGYMTIAHLAAYLVAKLRKADVQLQEKSGALEELQALHENIVRSMSGGVITTDLGGNIRVVNPAGERLLGRSPHGIIGTPIAALFPDPLPVAGEARREVKYPSPLGGEKIFGMAACALTIYGRDVVGRVYTFTDLTEIRRLEREVMVRDRMAAVGRLASGIAHEIRNPLAAIAGSAQMLRECPGLGDDERALLDIVRRESERLNKIVKDFLAYSRVNRYQFAEIDLLPLIEETLRLLENRPECAGGGVRVVREYRLPEAVASVDGDRIRQVFWNICDNALRAMPQGGTLTVALDAAPDGFTIGFTDTGGGISNQHLENIFEPFHSHFANGTGLGLAIVYQIMQAHGGEVAVQSFPEQGTQFSLYLKRPVGKDSRAETVVEGVARG
jgi:two-component system sensor histidine kinase PilS (NtrC family)